MKRGKYLLNFDIALLQSIVFYAILAILLLPYYQHQINPDGVSYISIAQKYLFHDYHNAINGYWGPLLSWLLLPFLFVGFEPLISVKLLSLTIGVMAIIQSNSLMKILEISRLLRKVLLYLIAFIVINFAFSTITPDLLFVCLALAYINIVLNPSYINNKYAGVIGGVLGVGLYLTKSYGFAFFIVHFFVVNLIFYLRTQNRDNRSGILNNFVSGIVVFSLISACWISIISNKYGQLTIGTAGSYNRAIMGPQSSGQPIHYVGLLDPPNNTAISIWEDVSYLRIRSWSTFDSIDSLKHQIKNTLKIIYRIISMLGAFSLLSLAILSMTVVYLLEKGKRIVTDNIFYLVISLVVLFSGYALLLIESRYIWLGNILIIIMGARLLDLLFQRILLRQIARMALIVIFVVSFSLQPLKELYGNLNTGKNIFNLNNKISCWNINGRIASNGQWSNSLYLSFYNGWQYYGEKGKLEESQLETELENKTIDYYFVWKPSEEKVSFLEQYEEITGDRIDELRIYKLR